MNASEYQDQAKRTLISGRGITAEITDKDMMILWNAIGIGGEAGEILNYIKKGILHRHWEEFQSDQIREEMIDELGDLMWYIAALCTKMGIALEEVMAKNIKKLEKRYPEGFDYRKSQHREEGLEKTVNLLRERWERKHGNPSERT